MPPKKKRKLNQKKEFKKIQNTQSGNYKTIKIPLKSILKKDLMIQPKINDLVLKINDLMIHTYQFIRLYILYQYTNEHNESQENDSDIFTYKIDEQFILYCMKTLKTKKKGGKKCNDSNLMKKLEEFYTKEYKPITTHKKTSINGIGQLMNYMATQIQTAYMNNIQEHFVQHIKRFINLTTTDITTNRSILYQFKNQILQQTETNILFNDWMNEHYEYICPSNITNSIHYDLTKQPFAYLKPMLYMNTYLENMEHKIFQPLPLQTNIIPKHVTLDTKCILNLFYSTSKTDNGLRIIKTENDIKELYDYKYKKIQERNKNKGITTPIKITKSTNPFFTMTELCEQITKYKYRVWDTLLNMQNRMFRNKSYVFDGLIRTDGISCSLTFIRRDLQGIENPSCSKKSTDTTTNQEYYYINELPIEQLQQLETYNIIGCDPGKHSMVYMIDENRKTLRYTTAQRNRESKNKRNKEILEHEKKKNNIIDSETKLSQHNCKTTNYNKFKDYLQAKTIYNEETIQFYQRDVWRKNKFRQYSYGRKSIDRFLNKIEKTYTNCNKKNILIGYGNWSRSTQMKHSMPSMGRGLRKIIHKRFNTVSIDEFNTSKKCCGCGNNLRHYYDSKKEKEVYRLLTCSDCGSSKNKQFVYRTRDANSAMNMLQLTHKWIHEQIRPIEFLRNPLPHSIPINSAVSTNGHW